ncbi:hypothetical protein DFP73DRAFT_526881 [Morchella snyderi]|nr:hypothetical protein DFP73DRAFT_526881 [Morchella snyderi]
MRPSTFLPLHTLVIILSVLIIVALAGVMLYFTKVLLPTRRLHIKVMPKPPASDGGLCHVCQQRKAVADRWWCCAGSPGGGSRRSGGSGSGPGDGDETSSSPDNTSSTDLVSSGSLGMSENDAHSVIFQ